MNSQKIVGWIGVAVAVVGAFVTIPYVGAILLIAGLIIGATIIADQHVRVIVSALALTAFAHLFDAIPSAGPYLTSIVASIGVLAGGAALTIIFRNLFARLKP